MIASRKIRIEYLAICCLLLISSQEICLADSISGDDIAQLTAQSDIVVIGRDVKEFMANPFRAIRPKRLCGYFIEPVQFIKGAHIDSGRGGNPGFFVDLLSRNLKDRSYPTPLTPLAKPICNDPNTQYLFFLHAGSTCGIGRRAGPLSAKKWFVPATKENIKKVKESILLPEKWGEQSRGVSMGIRPVKCEFSVSPLEPIVIDVFIKNVSNEPIEIPQHRTRENYYPCTSFHLSGVTMEKPSSGMSWDKTLPKIRIEPGEMYIDKVRLDSWAWRSTNGLSPFRAKTKRSLQARYLYKREETIVVLSQEVTIAFD